jgi:hypothetical protein
MNLSNFGLDFMPRSTLMARGKKGLYQGLGLVPWRGPFYTQLLASRDLILPIGSRAGRVFGI